jgi:cell division initiation protein
MKITPLEIKKQEFNTRLRGYDKLEVLSFLEMISEEMESLIRENLELKEKLQRAADKLSSYTKIESALQNTLVATQESAEQIKASAQEKADLIVREANAHAEKLVENSYSKLAELRQEYLTLRNQRAAFLVNFRSLIDSQQKLLELMEKQSDQLNRTLVIRKKAEMSSADVDRVVEEFKQENKLDSPAEESVQAAVQNDEQPQSSEDD